MRQHIDLAWLSRADHQSWFERTLTGLRPALSRVRLHELNWLADFELARDQNQRAEESAQVLANAVVDLRRYDALLITVSLDTLVWTRRCLAALPKTPVVPIIGMLEGLQSGAMIDLLELGMADFVQPAVCPHEFRARLIAVVCRAPRYFPLREPTVGIAPTLIDPRNPACTDPRIRPEPPAERLAVSHLAWPTVPFQENKQRIIALFEKQYLMLTLRRANGNITQAARLAQKDRRSYWELMRRHNITSDGQD
ncbi:helix-turn-helix domain-containing protein [Orrella daihaiensis]|uniref:DNA binding HTH domain-containing protein n=1 Tax=Orrella daihaiensis TaxID=2782176 RepID=A0ABY4AJV5_9BURK|nr:helix-turn-helix domain-containing protein [Orrella daihaiensis]UOD50238.1 hypothetical protein DHf2319_12505 [Orrella daihaiensis]